MDMDITKHGSNTISDAKLLSERIRNVFKNCYIAYAEKNNLPILLDEIQYNPSQFNTIIDPVIYDDCKILSPILIDNNNIFTAIRGLVTGKNANGAAHDIKDKVLIAKIISEKFFKLKNISEQEYNKSETLKKEFKEFKEKHIPLITEEEKKSLNENLKQEKNLKNVKKKSYLKNNWASFKRIICYLDLRALENNYVVSECNITKNIEIKYSKILELISAQLRSLVEIDTQIRQNYSECQKKYPINNFSWFKYFEDEMKIASNNKLNGISKGFFICLSDILNDLPNKYQDSFWKIKINLSETQITQLKLIINKYHKDLSTISIANFDLSDFKQFKKFITNVYKSSPNFDTKKIDGKLFSYTTSDKNNPSFIKDLELIPDTYSYYYDDKLFTKYILRLKITLNDGKIMWARANTSNDQHCLNIGDKYKNVKIVKEKITKSINFFHIFLNDVKYKINTTELFYNTSNKQYTPKLKIHLICEKESIITNNNSERISIDLGESLGTTAISNGSNTILVNDYIQSHIQNNVEISSAITSFDSFLKNLIFSPNNVYQLMNNISKEKRLIMDKFQNSSALTKTYLEYYLEHSFFTALYYYKKINEMFLFDFFNHDLEPSDPNYIAHRQIRRRIHGHSYVKCQGIKNDCLRKMASMIGYTITNVFQNTKYILIGNDFNESNDYKIKLENKKKLKFPFKQFQTQLEKLSNKNGWILMNRSESYTSIYNFIEAIEDFKEHGKITKNHWMNSNGKVGPEKEFNGANSHTFSALNQWKSDEFFLNGQNIPNNDFRNKRKKFIECFTKYENGQKFYNHGDKWLPKQDHFAATTAPLAMI